MTGRVLTRSFAGGELAPQMGGRIDDLKYQTGAAKLENFLVLPQGPVERRPGLEFVRQVKDPERAVRLLPFVHSTGQAFVIEMAAGIDVDGRDIGYFRFHTDGATVLYTKPRPYVSPLNPIPAGIDTSADSIQFVTPHLMETGDPVVLTTSGSPTLPTVVGDALAALTIYYVIAVPNTAGTVLQLARTYALALAGTPIDITAAGSWTSGEVRLHFAYAPADLAQWNGVGPGSFYCIQAPYLDHLDHPPTDTDYWYREPEVDPDTETGVYEVPHTYPEDSLFALQVVQSGDVLTIGAYEDEDNGSFGATELRRYAAAKWILTDIDLAPTLEPPDNLAVSGFGGNAIQILSASGVTQLLTLKNAHQLREGDPVRVTGASAAPPGGCGLPDGTYIVKEPTFATAAASSVTTLGLRQVNGGATVSLTTNASLSDFAAVRPVALAGLLDTNTYVVTAVDADGSESQASDEETEITNLDVAGSYNDITWDAVTGASRYRVYKELNGLFGLIGETEGTTFRDDGITPDLSDTPPKFDPDAADYPKVVGYFEGRRGFANFTDDPQRFRLTRSGTESDMSYHEPVQADDRISEQIKSRQLAVIRHMVDLGRLVLLTSSGEFVVRPLDSDILTPGQLAARCETYVGASTVAPALVNGAIVFAADRGGHVIQCGFAEGGRLRTDDLSVRAAHLFDGLTVVQIAVSKAPQPRLWVVSSDGRILVCTYMPEEQVVAWSQLTTEPVDGQDPIAVFESVCVIPDGDEDRVYVVVQRNINFEVRRHIERLGASTSECFLDASLSFDGTNDTDVRVAMDGGDEWVEGESVTITVDTPGIFDASVFPSPDIGDHLRITAPTGEVVDVEITAVANAQEATGTLLADVPTSLQPQDGTPYATASWAWARDSFGGLDHLVTKNVATLADGIEQQQQAVSDAGTIGLFAPTHAVKVHVGLPYASLLQTLPVAMQVDGFGQGRPKNVTQAWVRVIESGRFEIGPTAAKLGATTAIPRGALATAEVPVQLPTGWQDTGQVFVRQTAPLPLNIVALCLRVTTGGD